MSMRWIPSLLTFCLLAPAWAQPAEAPPEEAPPPQVEDASRYSAGRVRLGGEEGFGFGTATDDPTALEGPSRIETVLLNSRYWASFSPSAHYLTDRFLIEATGGPDMLGGDVSYRFADHLTVNLWGVSSRNPAFESGRLRVRLPNNEQPFVRFWGAGLEYFEEASDEFAFAAALNFQNVNVGSDLFGPVVLPPVDQLGNPLTFSPTGRDELLTLNFVGQYNALDDLSTPSEGTRLRFRVEQAVPVGDSQIGSTMLAVNLAHLIPAPGLGEGSSYLLLNAQGGSIAGDVPPYRAFNLGGSNSVRGYQIGGLTTARSFVQLTGEYRASLTEFELFGQNVDMKGVLFFDYASDLGTAGSVWGQPGVARQKPGDGIGYGAGLYFFSDVGLFRLETGWNEQGQNQWFFTLGDRF